MRILIVEDERRLAEALGAIMEEQKYSADVVFNGQDGLDYALSGAARLRGWTAVRTTI